jgi:hypothetical protein
MAKAGSPTGGRDIGAVEYGSRWLIYLPIVLKN